MFSCLCFSFYGGTKDTRESTFFTPKQRSVAVSQILRTTSFGKRSKGEVGIEQLLEDTIFTAAYPLHDVSSLCFVKNPIDRKYSTVQSFAHFS